MPAINPDSLLSVTQAAKLARISRQGIHYQLNNGLLAYVEIGGRRYIRREDLPAEPEEPSEDVDAESLDDLLA